MQLSDNISTFLYPNSLKSINAVQGLQDPTYLEDLKLHLNDNLEYRRDRIKWRRKKPASWKMTQVREEFFKEFCETGLETFHRDIEIFIREHSELTPEDGARMFCGKWKGYEKSYGVEFVERAMRRCELCLSK